MPAIPDKQTSVGFFAEVLSSVNPRGLHATARSIAEQLVKFENLKLVCLLRPVTHHMDEFYDPLETCYTACDLRQWLKLNPYQFDKARSRFSRFEELIEKLLEWFIYPGFLRARIHPLVRFIQNRLRTNKYLSGGIDINVISLNQLDYMMVFNQYNEVLNNPLENGSVKVIGWFHDAIPIRINEGPNSRGPYEFVNAVSRMVHKSSRLICSSRASESDLNTFFPESIGKSVTIHVGHERDKFSNAHNHREIRATLEHLDINPDIPYLLVLGVFEPRKNTTNILRACIELAKKRTDQLPQLVWIGENGQKNNYSFLLGQLQKKMNVTFTGYLDEPSVIKLTQGAKVFLFPSLWEGFGIPPLEAMSAGTIVIAADISSMPEVCGKQAFYCDPYDYLSITDAIANTLDMNGSERKGWIERSKKYAADFTWEKTANRIVKNLGWEVVC